MTVPDVAVPTSAAAPTGVFSPPVEVPAGTESVIDDTGFLIVGVPPAWSGRSTAPIAGADGVAYPYIAAAADLEHVPPVGRRDAEPERWLRRGLHRRPVRCRHGGAAGWARCPAPVHRGPVQQYADAVFTGHIQELTACAGSQTRRYLVVGNPADSRFTAVVLVQVTDDPSVLNTVLATFDYEPTATAPGEPRLKDFHRRSGQI